MSLNSHTKLIALAATWRERATELRRWAAADGAAAALERAAEDLEKEIASVESTALTLAEAAAASAYSVEHIGRLVRKGQIPNVGRKNAPRVLLGDLPVRAMAHRSKEGYNPVTDARSLVGSRR